MGISVKVINYFNTAVLECHVKVSTLMNVFPPLKISDMAFRCMFQASGSHLSRRWTIVAQFNHLSSSNWSSSNWTTRVRILTKSRWIWKGNFYSFVRCALNFVYLISAWLSSLSSVVFYPLFLFWCIYFLVCVCFHCSSHIFLSFSFASLMSLM